MEEVVKVNGLGDAVIERMKEKGLLPEILDYAIASSAGYQYEVCDLDFEVKCDVNYGGSEGIYLDTCLEGVFGHGDENITAPFITFKTLEESDEALRTMCNLQADCMIATREYLKEHADEFKRKGVRMTREDGLEDYDCYYTFHHKEQIFESAKPGRFRVTDLYYQTSQVYEKDASGKLICIEN